MPDVQNVVLVHGGFVDGSGWRGVYDLLTADGFNVSVVQNQTLSLESDVRTTHNVLDLLDGPAILVGHSYGGAVISEAGRHERVAGLVYIAAFAPDAGESVNTLIADPPPGAPVRRCAGAPVRRCRRSCRPSMGSCSLTARSSRRRSPRTRVAQQAELVPRRHRRPHDPAAGAARHVRAGRLGGRRSAGQSYDLRLAAAGDRRSDHGGRTAGPRRDGGDRAMTAGRSTTR